MPHQLVPKVQFYFLLDRESFQISNNHKYSYSQQLLHLFELIFEKIFKINHTEVLPVGFVTWFEIFYVVCK